MDELKEAIQRFIDDVFEYKRCDSLEKLTNDLYLRELDPERHKGYTREHIDKQIQMAYQTNWDAKEPAIKAHRQLLKSGATLVPHLAQHAAVASKLHEFLYYFDWRVIKRDKAMECWPDLCIALNVLLSAANLTAGHTANGAAVRTSPVKTGAVASTGWYGKPVAEFMARYANDDEANMKQFVREWNRKEPDSGRQIKYTVFRSRIAEAKRQRTPKGVHNKSSAK